MTDIQSVIKESEECLGMNTEQLAELICVPFPLLKEWKDGLLPQIYEPLLAFALLYFTDQKRRETRLQEIKAELESENYKQKVDAKCAREYGKMIGAAGTLERGVDGKSVIKYFENEAK